jgi:predicted metal-dependent phosphoesterase TrpH
VNARRLAALALYAAGIVGGSLLPPPALHEPVRAGGYWVLAVDFHVHGFPGDGALAPGLLRDEAARAGLDAFVLTNHNGVATARAARRLAAGTPGPIVIVGQEITARGFHIAAAGLEAPVDWTHGAAAAIRAVHAQGGVAIAAHPGRDYRQGWDDDAVALLDGYERAHPSMRDPDTGVDLAAFAARVSATRPNAARIGSSDFHSKSGSPGACRTWVLARERSAAGIIAAVREGRTVAVGVNGQLYGSPDDVRLVRDAAAMRLVPPRDTAASRAAAAAAALGLLMLILL